MSSVDTILSQLNSIHTISPKMRFHILSYTLVFPRFTTKCYVCHMCKTPGNCHRPWFDQCNNISEVYTLWSSLIRISLRPPPPLVWNTLIPSATCSQLPQHNIWPQCGRPSFTSIQNRGSNHTLCILLFTFFYIVCNGVVTVKSKVQQSLYTPWRRLGGEEV
jgi:hypothetical protein